MSEEYTVWTGPDDVLGPEIMVVHSCLHTYTLRCIATTKEYIQDLENAICLDCWRDKQLKAGEEFCSNQHQEDKLEALSLEEVE